MFQFFGGASSGKNNMAMLNALEQTQARILFKPDGTIVDANPNFCQALGYSLDQLVGQHHRIFCEPSYTQTASYTEFWEKLQQGRPQIGTFKRFTSAGQSIYIQASYTPIKNGSGRVVNVVKYAVDVSIPTNKTNEAIGRTQAVISFSLDGIITEVNDTFLNALGYHRDEVVGQHHRIFCKPDYTESTEYTNFWRRLHSGEPAIGEFERVKKNGQSIIIQASYNPLFDLEGNVIGVTKYATDITHMVHTKSDAKNIALSTSASIEEMTASISDIAQSMLITKDASESATSSASETLDKVQQLLVAGENMSSIVELIESISDQINLLSLNAAIEAARAGDAGRGFSVVADEVKKLASNVSSSTSEIVEEIESMRNISRQISSSVSEMSNMVDQTHDSATAVAAATEEQSAAVNDISIQVNNLSELVGQL